jgi:hypothetical protein
VTVVSIESEGPARSSETGLATTSRGDTCRNCRLLYLTHPGGSAIDIFEVPADRHGVGVRRGAHRLLLGTVLEDGLD